MVNCFQPIAISVDGPDGAGKSTIVSHISKKFHTICPLPAIGLGLMPFTQDERLDWYEGEDPIVVARTILASQKKTYCFLEEYAQKIHFKQTDRKINSPHIIVFDRGPISAKAYSYACLRLNTDLPCDVINQIVNLYFNVGDLEEKIFYIDLYTKTSDAEKFFERATNIIDNRIDFLLVRGQIEYYQKFYSAKNAERTLKLNPFDSLQMNLKKVDDFIYFILKNNVNDDRARKKSRIYLTALLQNIMKSKRHGEIRLYGEIVARGYTDYDVYVKCEKSCDLEIFASFKNIVSTESEHFAAEEPCFLITPQSLLSDEEL